jgi:deazaflavin-dependent oxidoreductase (nitroreductase family)
MISGTSSRGRRCTRLLGVVALAAAALAATFVVGMRRKSPGVQRAVRRMNKAFVNPRAMHDAGTPGAYASVIHHVGRRSGTTYETPVVPEATEDGFVIALPYGTHADWVQNVLAAGRATVTHDGATYEVDHPEVVPTDTVETYFDASDRRAHRAMHVDECLRLHRVLSTASR